MGDEALGGVCSGKRWNPPFFSGGSGGWSSLCSVAQLGTGCEVISSFGWPSEAVKGNHDNILHYNNNNSNNNNNNNSSAFDDNSIIFPVDMDSTFDAIFPSDCQQINLLGKDGGNDGNFGSIIQDDINQGLFMCTNNISTNNNNSCNQDIRSSPMPLTTTSNNSSSGDSSTITGEGCGGGGGGGSGGGLTTAFDPINSSASYLIQTLFDDIDDHNNSPFIKPNYMNNNNNNNNELVSPCNNSWVTNTNSNNCGYPPLNLQLHPNNVNRQLVDGTMNVMTDHVNSNIQASLLNSYNLHSRSSRASTHSSNHGPKVNSVQTRDTKVQVGQSKGSGNNEQPPVNKRARIETPSPLPTFKVRKEKLGDRITALQQLVSPFGKTDTASVLHEAIEYIKFLHDQVNALCTPYLKNGAPIQQQDHEKSNEDTNEDLRSRGLCLVPISSTYPMAQETPVDFWTPTFGGTTYR